jgi:hypothetical protein
MSSAENKKLAEKLLKIFESSANSPDVAALFASIEKINHRLDKLEAAQNEGSYPIQKTILNHPSFDKFPIAEAVADIASKEKTCTFEPNGRPCDHCSMCSARGF